MKKILMSILLSAIATTAMAKDLTSMAIEGLKRVDNGAVLIDVRSYEEYDSGHIEGSINIPLDQLEFEMRSFNQNQNMVFYCRSGNRSSRATEALKSFGYTNVYDAGAYEVIKNNKVN